MSKEKLININADFGESFKDKIVGDDEALIPYLDTVNLACGFHGGDNHTIYKSINLASSLNKEIGSHPSFDDLAGFGRTQFKLSYQQLESLLVYQISAVSGLCEYLSTKASHVKLHGALNNLAAVDHALASQIVDILLKLNKDLIILNPAVSNFTKLCKKAGFKVGYEIFADRGYDDKGNLLARNLDGAIISDKYEMADRMLNFLAESAIITKSLKKIPTKIDSICIHGDHKNAAENAKYLRETLASEGYKFVGLKEKLIVD